MFPYMEYVPTSLLINFVFNPKVSYNISSWETNISTPMWFDVIIPLDWTHQEIFPWIVSNLQDGVRVDWVGFNK